MDTRQLMAEAKFYEGYSRYSDLLSRYETWEEAVTRVMEMHLSYYKDKVSASAELLEFIDQARRMYETKRVLGAQRALQFGGEQLLKHQIRMYNCVSSYADRPEFFQECMYMLLCGAGAGFSVQTQHISKLPCVKSRSKKTSSFTVEDSVEGWSDAFGVLLSSFFEDGGHYPAYEGKRIHFDLTNVRPKGSYISGGFKAPGPAPLRRALDAVETMLINIVKQEERQLRSIEVYDIVMHMADAVISGGVRRSATICMFSHDDWDMATAKTGDWFDKHPHRARSNNSAVILRDEITRKEFSDIMRSVRDAGEPGFIFTDNKEFTFNPCVEIGKYPVTANGVSGWQGCNLSEINGGQCTSAEHFYEACRAAATLGTLQAGYTDFKYLSDVTKEIFEREALIGVSVTGWMSNPDVLFDEEVMRKGAQIVKETNKKVANLLGIKPAARTTCVKPSGNASVLLGTASGIHGEHSPRYIRTVQMNKEGEVAKLIAKNNPSMVEDSVWSANGTDYAISFPVESPTGSKYKSELLGVKQLEYVKLAQQVWVEEGTNVDLCVDKRLRHNVSNTITVNDWDEVEQYVFDNRHWFAGISFLPASGDKAFPQAPFSEVKTEIEIVNEYGKASLFASGLLVDGLHAFADDLWAACSTALGYGQDLTKDCHQNALKRDWVRRVVKFANNYFSGNKEAACDCMKDVYRLHKWTKIVSNFKAINWINELEEKSFTDIDTMGAIACVGNGCEF